MRAATSDWQISMEGCMDTTFQGWLQVCCSHVIGNLRHHLINHTVPTQGFHCRISVSISESTCVMRKPDLPASGTSRRSIEFCIITCTYHSPSRSAATKTTTCHSIGHRSMTWNLQLVKTKGSSTQAVMAPVHSFQIPDESASTNACVFSFMVKTSRSVTSLRSKD